MARLLSEMVCTVRKVGTFTRTETSLGGEVSAVRKDGGNVAGYLCTPEGQVVHGVVGPASPRELRVELHWALGALAKARAAAARPQDWPVWMQLFHRARAWRSLQWWDRRERDPSTDWSRDAVATMLRMVAVDTSRPAGESFARRVAGACEAERQSAVSIHLSERAGSPLRPVAEYLWERVLEEVWSDEAVEVRRYRIEDDLPARQLQVSTGCR